MEMSGNSRFNGEDHALEISRNPCKEAIGNENVSLSLCICWGLCLFLQVCSIVIQFRRVENGWQPNQTDMSVVEQLKAPLGVEEKIAKDITQ